MWGCLQTRSPVEGHRARTIPLAAALTLAALLGACATGAGERSFAQAFGTLPVNGPQADYPVVVGPPYAVGGTEYVPADVLNYDEVGFAAADTAGGSAVSGSHHTLPLPSYVEVTSLDSGRTALVRIERRGPMSGTELVALSPGALTQLGLAAAAPVRVRRVNPPEEHRALLRAGQSAPLRMDTPITLVEVLRRKLPVTAEAPAAPASTANEPTLQAISPAPNPVPPALPPLEPRATSAQAIEAEFVVQVAAFSTADRAAQAAAALGAEVSRAGRYFRVRTGPFATRGEAEASLAKVRAAGYRDARIFTSG